MGRGEREGKRESREGKKRKKERKGSREGKKKKGMGEAGWAVAHPLAGPIRSSPAHTHKSSPWFSLGSRGICPVSKIQDNYPPEQIPISKKIPRVCFEERDCYHL